MKLPFFNSKKLFQIITNPLFRTSTGNHVSKFKFLKIRKERFSLSLCSFFNSCAIVFNDLFQFGDPCLSFISFISTSASITDDEVTDSLRTTEYTPSGKYQKKIDFVPMSL